MTIQNESIRINYTADGVQTVFNMTNILVFDAAHVFVYLDDVITPTGWVFVGEDDPNGGTVTFDTAPADQVNVTLERQVPQNQLADYVPYDAFPAETHERQLDLAAMGRQQLQDLDTRAITFPPSYEGDGSIPAPIPLAHLATDADAVMLWEPLGGVLGVVTISPDNETSDGTIAAAVVEALPASPDPRTLYFITGTPVP